jgi:hypothetical protein
MATPISHSDSPEEPEDPKNPKDPTDHDENKGGEKDKESQEEPKKGGDGTLEKDPLIEAIKKCLDEGNLEEAEALALPRLQEMRDCNEEPTEDWVRICQRIYGEDAKKYGVLEEDKDNKKKPDPTNGKEWVIKTLDLVRKRIIKEVEDAATDPFMVSFIVTSLAMMASSINELAHHLIESKHEKEQKEIEEKKQREVEEARRHKKDDKKGDSPNKKDVEDINPPGDIM